MNTTQHYGIIGVFGKPNAGKSTFLNAVIGQKLAAVSRKAHTTRHQISGIFIEGNYQILFLDTPGSVEFAKRNKLQQSMANEIKETEAGLDLAIYLVDCQKGVGGIYLPQIHSLAKRYKENLRVVLSKVDSIKNFELPQIEKSITAFLEENKIECNREILRVSSKDRLVKRDFLEQVKTYISEGPWQHSADDLSLRSYKFMIEEMLREQIYRQLGHELPFQTDVVVEKLEDGKGLCRVDACIYVSEERYRGMIVGKGGLKIKAIGTNARLNLEKNYDKKFHLDLFVKRGTSFAQ